MRHARKHLGWALDTAAAVAGVSAEILKASARPRAHRKRSGDRAAPACRGVRRVRRRECGATTPTRLGRVSIELGWLDVRYAPDKDQIQQRSEMSRWAMCGRLRVGKENRHVAGLWSVQPCVRPLNAVHMTAGHNALRGSGPGQFPAFENAVAHVGCPDRRIDRLCITCCSPSQPSHHATVRGRDLVRPSAQLDNCIARP